MRMSIIMMDENENPMEVGSRTAATEIVKLRYRNNELIEQVTELVMALQKAEDLLLVEMQMQDPLVTREMMHTLLRQELQAERERRELSAELNKKMKL